MTRNRFFFGLTLFFLLFVCPLFAQNFNVTQRAVVDFPGQTLANICGYTAKSREYALVGGSRELIIVDVTAPATPVIIKRVPGVINSWKEIKTYKNFAYVVSEGRNSGVQIVDLTNLPDTTLAVKTYFGDGVIEGQLSTIHALHIDEKKGFLYAHGSNLAGGGPIILDLKDPANPKYAGRYTQLNYVHDGYADNDTLYAAHIYTGTLAVVDMRDKANPKVLGSVNTPGKFTHNAWMLSDRKTVLTTDEATPSFVTAYNVSDPTDIKEIDRFSTNNGMGSIGHNVHIQNDWAITSWYTDGVSIVDAHRPQNLIETGRFDTWAGTGANFNGCWGVYPNFPSGTIVASNINPAQMFVLTPTYRRAAYFEGQVRSGCDNLPLSGATISIVKGQDQASEQSNQQGIFRTGHVNPGTYTVTISKSGFQTRTLTVSIETAKVVEQNIVLEPVTANNITGTVLDAETNRPIANAPVLVSNPLQNTRLNTDANGQFSLSCTPSGNYTVLASNWGYLPATGIPINGAGAYVVSLKRGYYDDFGFDLGWSATPASGVGAWARGVPVGTTFNNDISNPDKDVPGDTNEQCYVTGNGGGQAGTDDVDVRRVTLTSPNMELARYADAELSFQYWFYNGGGSGNPPPAPNDTLEVRVTNGSQSVRVFLQTTSASQWRSAGPIRLRNLIPLTNTMRVEFITGDADPGHLVEAALDVFRVEPMGTSGVLSVIDAGASVVVSPNPSAGQFNLQYAWPDTRNIQLEVRNLLGQLVEADVLTAGSGVAAFGESLLPGVYIAVLRAEGRQSRPVKIVKE
jgi:choice-of-anchor B domain-containing protein